MVMLRYDTSYQHSYNSTIPKYRWEEMASNISTTGEVKCKLGQRVNGHWYISNRLVRKGSHRQQWNIALEKKNCDGERVGVGIGMGVRVCGHGIIVWLCEIHHICTKQIPKEQEKHFSNGSGIPNTIGTGHVHACMCKWERWTVINAVYNRWRV